VRYKIVIPPTADGALKVRLVSWIRKTGDQVTRGQDLAEAATEKITLYVTSPADGTLSEILAEPGAQVEVGAVIGLLEGA
jgi:pyruvate/2-oxoglutarate dehydrogenase complex dihydrolipoamide acyltransferase (E2) component